LIFKPVFGFTLSYLTYPDLKKLLSVFRRQVLSFKTLIFSLHRMKAGANESNFWTDAKNFSLAWRIIPRFWRLSNNWRSILPSNRMRGCTNAKVLGSTLTWLLNRFLSQLNIVIPLGQTITNNIIDNKKIEIIEIS
jgi:hypothetical protein